MLVQSMFFSSSSSQTLLSTFPISHEGQAVANMAIRQKRKRQPTASDRFGVDNKRETNDVTASIGCFQGISALFIDGGVSPKRLQIWKGRFKELGGTVVELGDARCKKGLTHVIATDNKFISPIQSLNLSKKVIMLKYSWIEECLKEGKLLLCEPYKIENAQCISSSCQVEKTLAIPDDSFVESGLQTLSTPTEIENRASIIREFSTTAEMNLQEPILYAQEKLGSRSDSEEEGGCQRDAIDDLVMIERSGPNEHITGILREMSDIYGSVLGDEWRSLTYRKAMSQLERVPYRISTSEDVKGLHGIGTSMAEKINEILCTGQLQKLENLKSDSKVRTLRLLASVWGVGPKLAQKLYRMGHRNVEDLIKEPSLTRMAQIGVRYYEDILLRIPRDEVAAAEMYVLKIAADICPMICIGVAGSYRRGRSTCGDIDFLATHPDGFSHTGFLVRLVEKLRHTGFIKDGVHVTDHSSEDNINVDTFMGICLIPGYQHYRRLDMKVYPKECYAFALVYFTGNDILNRKLRSAAQLRGYKLNDQGLFMRIGGKKGISSTTCIPCETEREVFEKVGFPYYEPCDRNL